MTSFGSISDRFGAFSWPPFEESIQVTLNQLVHNWFKCIVYTQPTNEFKPQLGPNFLFAQVGYRNRVLTSHILQILGRPSNIRGCEKTPTLHTLTSLLHQGILLEIPAALSLNPYLFRANKNVRKENRCLFFGATRCLSFAHPELVWQVTKRTLKTSTKNNNIKHMK